MKIKILTEAKKRRQLPEKGGKTPIRTTASFPQIIAEARRNDITIFKSWKKRTVNPEYYIHWKHLSWMKRKSPQKKRKLKDLLLPHFPNFEKKKHGRCGAQMNSWVVIFPSLVVCYQIQLKSNFCLKNSPGLPCTKWCPPSRCFFLPNNLPHSLNPPSFEA